ncbi:hypothetical protein ACFWXZ_14415 [[Kitasatospora] papulosa]|uniref:zinc finger domain-containing protein n=1 Tax=[Kitasatospora] papulosa TaxID=1464011 RepID=UPI00369479F6
MQTYAIRDARTKTTGHLRQDGTRTTYCNRAVGIPNGDFTGLKGWKMCQPCVTSEARDRAHAEEVAAQHAEQAAPVATLETLAVSLPCPTCHAAAGSRCVTRASKPARETHGRRFEAVEEAAGITEHRAAARREATARGGWVVAFDRKAEDALLTAYAARGKARAATPEEPQTTQPKAAVRDEPSDWWTIMDPATGEEITRVYGETYQEMTPRAEALPEVRAVIRAHKGFSRRRLYVSELTPAQRADQISAPAMPSDADRAAAARESRQTAELITEAEATAGTWRGQWIGDTTALFDRPTEQGALFA